MTSNQHTLSNFLLRSLGNRMAYISSRFVELLTGFCARRIGNGGDSRSPDWFSAVWFRMLIHWRNLYSFSSYNYEMIRQFNFQDKESSQPMTASWGKLASYEKTAPSSSNAVTPTVRSPTVCGLLSVLFGYRVSFEQMLMPLMVMDNHSLLPQWEKSGGEWRIGARFTSASTIHWIQRNVVRIRITM